MRDKQNAIINAYGECWKLLSGGDQIFALENNGWIPRERSYMIVVDLENGLYDTGEEIWNVRRPKSLSGIDNNNGWTSLNESHPVPYRERYSITTMDGTIEHDVIWHPKGEFFMNEDEEIFSTRHFSHFRPFEKIKPPIY